jgi:type IV pilus assembly protein PilC
MQSTYAFRARDGAGGIVTGMLAGESADAVANRLRSEGKYVLSVKDNPGDITEELSIDEIRRQEAAKSVTREDVISFARELSVMLETGVPLAEALDAFLLHTSKKDFRQVIEALRNDIHAGEAFSVAMARWPRAFPNMMVSLMKASEASGTMAEMLGRIADYLAKERKTAKKIKGAIAYPLFMMGTALLMTGFLIVFVLPRFARIYEMRSTSLPAPTQFLLDVSSFVTTQY